MIITTLVAVSFSQLQALDFSIADRILSKCKYSLTAEDVRNMAVSTPRINDQRPADPRFLATRPLGWIYILRRTSQPCAFWLQSKSSSLNVPLTDAQAIARANDVLAAVPLGVHEQLTLRFKRTYRQDPSAQEINQFSIARRVNGYNVELGGVMLVNKMTGDVERLSLPVDPIVDRTISTTMTSSEARSLMQAFLRLQLGDGVAIDTFAGPRYADPVDMMRLLISSGERVRNLATESEKQRAKDWKAFLVFRALYSQLDGQRKGEIFVDAETKRVLFSSYAER